MIRPIPGPKKRKSNHHINTFLVRHSRLRMNDKLGCIGVNISIMSLIHKDSMCSGIQSEQKNWAEIKARDFVNRVLNECHLSSVKTPVFLP